MIILHFNLLLSPREALKHFVFTLSFTIIDRNATASFCPAQLKVPRSAGPPDRRRTEPAAGTTRYELHDPEGPNLAETDLG